MQRKIPRLIPVLLLSKNGLYKTRKFKSPRYVGDPINAVRIFNEKEVDEIAFLDIDASKESREPNLKSISDISSECFMPLAYGGGVSSLLQIEKILKLGVEKIIVNTALFLNPGFVLAAVREFGGSTIVGSIDFRSTMFGRKIAYVKGGRLSTRILLEEYVSRVNDLGVGEMLLNSIDRDGMLTGYDISAVKTVSRLVSMPVIACGGSRGLEDQRSVILEGGASAAAAGSQFVFVGRHQAVLINYPAQTEIREIFKQSYY